MSDMSDHVEPYEALTDDKSEALAFARRMALARSKLLEIMHSIMRTGRPYYDKESRHA
jgi:hypothetical protein